MSWKKSGTVCSSFAAVTRSWTYFGDREIQDVEAERGEDHRPVGRWPQRPREDVVERSRHESAVAGPLLGQMRASAADAAVRAALIIELSRHAKG